MAMKAYCFACLLLSYLAIHYAIYFQFYFVEYISSEYKSCLFYPAKEV